MPLLNSEKNCDYSYFKMIIKKYTNFMSHKF